jgi:pyruvate ferredoxin oxidoreductase gamma subunit
MTHSMDSHSPRGQLPADEDRSPLREIVFCGLGGQGVVTAAQVLARATSLYQAQYSQSIPAFTAERRGAPVHAYIRLSPDPILAHSFIYDPDCVVVFSWAAAPWHELREAGRMPAICLANLRTGQRDLFLGLGVSGGYLDADALTQEVLGSESPPNMAMLGAFAAVTGWVTLKAIAEAILASWPSAIGERNALIAERAYATVCRVGN